MANSRVGSSRGMVEEEWTYRWLYFFTKKSRKVCLICFAVWVLSILDCFQLAVFDMIGLLCNKGDIVITE